jgi:hypothetical protein
VRTFPRRSIRFAIASLPAIFVIAIAERTDSDADGARRLQPSAPRWLTADLTLAPLASGDYIVELTVLTANAEQRTVTAIRVVR